MRTINNGPTRNTCDEMLTTAKTAAQLDRRRRFLDAYAECARIAPAARLAGVHRATVHRWLAEPGFAAALRDAFEVFYRRNRERVLADEHARRLWREERERARRPMRCHYLARARAAKGR